MVKTRLNRPVFGGGSNWMSRKKRSSPPQKEIATAVSVTPKTCYSENGAESISSSIHTQSSTSGSTPVAKKRRNTFGSRKAPQVYDSVSDDFFFSPSILCRKNLVKLESKKDDDHPSSSPSDSADKSSISEGYSISGAREGEPRVVATQDALQSQSNEFDFDDTASIHSTVFSGSIKQPSSTLTSLEEARAYFARLDASPLVIEPADDSEKRHKVVRTRRRLLPTHPVVMKEYRQYEHACESAQVSTMSLEDFARHRKKFQSQDVLYEGFLDADD